MKSLAMVGATLILVGCAGHTTYSVPSAQPVREAASKQIDQPRDEVWAAAVPALGKKFFVINNMDKASGFINLSYSGDPEKYVDCGRIESYVKNAAGERRYSFPASSASQQYEILEPGRGLFRLTRRMALEGRINLVFEIISPEKTRVTASVRYVLKRDIQAFNVGSQQVGSLSHSISFNSGQIESFPPSGDGNAAVCVPTGELERELLSAVQ